MKLYVGLDVGLEETSLCIVDSEGVTVREVKVSTEPLRAGGLRGSAHLHSCTQELNRNNGGFLRSRGLRSRRWRRFRYQRHE